ncbi:Uncharacterised protein [Mycobacterium tuberculosis]|nr:Uncharacterised protein [Mycobacterium tuberculosis]CNU94859.1 Uncharacterised protein [Mycobacterium tuberculosis]CNU99960.1 Uncharacterised protein [Mycobacterium tuberculosis]SGO08450.1 Uncharacterised protein [Mycobacterium tuberculosis]
MTGEVHVVVGRLVLHHPKAGGTELFDTVLDDLHGLQPLVVGDRSTENDHEIRRFGPGPFILTTAAGPGVHIRSPRQAGHQGRDGVGQLGHRRPVLVLGVLQRGLGAQRVLQLGDLLRAQRPLLAGPRPVATGSAPSRHHTHQSQQPRRRPPHQRPPLSAGPGAAGMPPPRIGGSSGGPTVLSGSPAAIAARL